MILFLPSDSTPNSATLERFLFAFRTAEVSEMILNGCDISVSFQDGMLENCIAPREEGLYDRIMRYWHLDTSPYYPFTNIEISPTGIRAVTDPSPYSYRCRLVGSTVEWLTLYDGSYESFLYGCKGYNLNPYFVSQDFAGRFLFKEPDPTSQHTRLSTTMNYHPEEYLCV